MTGAQILKVLLDLCAEAEHHKAPLDTAEVKKLAEQAYGTFAQPKAGAA